MKRIARQVAQLSAILLCLIYWLEPSPMAQSADKPTVVSDQTMDASKIF
jgi:hypothetical protein